jgi:hypothetical protein
MSYRAVFTDVNDPYARYLIVCVDKTWGQPGCQPWTGDWVSIAPGMPGYQVSSPYFTPSKVLTAVTSSDLGYYYQVQIVDINGNVVKTCNYVDRNHPCYYYVSAPPSPSPSPPTYPPPSSPSPPTIPTAPGLSTTNLLIIAGVLAASALIGFGVAYAVSQSSKK